MQAQLFLITITRTAYRNKTSNKNVHHVKTQKMARILRAFVMFGSFERKHLSRAVYQAVKYSVFALGCAAAAFPGHVGQEFIYPACHPVSQKKKKMSVTKATHSLADMPAPNPTRYYSPQQNIVTANTTECLTSETYQTKDEWHTSCPFCGARYS